MLTAYDSYTSSLLEKVGVDGILVGDSYGMVVLGHGDTKSVTFDQMIAIAKDVRLGAPNSFVVFDMPYKTYENSLEALKNSKQAIDETGCDAVKIEGRPDIVKYLVQNGIKVLGHSGLKPQEVNKFSIQGRTQFQRRQIVNEALALQKAGAFAVVLECVPQDLAKEITEILTIPTIGIGAGDYTSGQVRVTHDILGWQGGKSLKFIKQYNDPQKNDFENLKDFVRELS